MSELKTPASLPPVFDFEHSSELEESARQYDGANNVLQKQRSISQPNMMSSVQYATLCLCAAGTSP